jgi:hypothetical protein
LKYVKTSNKIHVLPLTGDFADSAVVCIVTWFADVASTTIGQLPRGCYWDGREDVRFNLNEQLRLQATNDADQPERGAICRRVGPPLVSVGHATIGQKWEDRVQAGSEVCAELVASVQ